MRWLTDNTFAVELTEFYVETPPQQSPDPSLVILNEPLALELGFDPAALASPEGAAVLVGNAIPEGAHVLAMTRIRCAS